MLRWAKLNFNRFTADKILHEAASMSLLCGSCVKTQPFTTMHASGEPFAREQNYENAISSLNSLQSNFSVLQASILRKHTDDCKHINDTIKYLERVGLSLSSLDKLPAIHVSGTKGKGSTCAMIESILRSNGYRTGFFSSPHLVSVTERVRLNGKPVSTDKFNSHFWKIYNQLVTSREHIQDMPSYFCFLTILAFDIFLQEAVDVCVIEVGIGGRYDCTNVLRKTNTVGITSLGLEHTKLLGNTLGEIAWQKAGIIKPDSDVFTVPQPTQCIEVIEQECHLSKANLHIVPPGLQKYSWAKKPSLMEDACNIIELNTSLAIQIATCWIRKMQKTAQLSETMLVTKQTVKGIEDCFWPGRLQQISYDTQKTLYLDGAHTVESIEVCARWYNAKSKCDHKRLLIFNTTGDRDSLKLLSTLLGTIKFDAAFFVPNVALSSATRADAINHNFPFEHQMQRCRANHVYWVEAMKHKNGFVHESIDSVFAQIDKDFACEISDILITGSVHLIGAVLTALKLERFISARE
ncbi:folylpolyglutamate synthase, mitochondrial-like isoform X1 [Anopheles moucheti]|uniref:folylpolyglutamate synthase, mitochondrial-like isoform X1 n=2 Tax=Anopheles moucheti TaxID=186751 RepID=UPI0022F05587|nr:folylpolyglutamate synthase, mitochondrial-like isoform X1 [Anopheles moucheti]